MVGRRVEEVVDPAGAAAVDWHLALSFCQVHSASANNMLLTTFTSLVMTPIQTFVYCAVLAQSGTAAAYHEALSLLPQLLPDMHNK